jgi:hypothetical protein
MVDANERLFCTSEQQPSARFTAYGCMRKQKLLMDSFAETAKKLSTVGFNLIEMLSY